MVLDALAGMRDGFALTAFRLCRYHFPIMVAHLPELISPIALAEKGRHFKGALPLARMPRLADTLANTVGEARIDLVFAKEGRVFAIQGWVEADVELQCQCCLGPIPWRVRSEVRLGVVDSLEAAELLPESFEPLLLEEESIPLIDIVQDEILLAIPTIPQHAECKTGNVPDMPAETGEQRPNPFSILADLKKLK